MLELLLILRCVRATRSSRPRTNRPHLDRSRSPPSTSFRGAQALNAGPHGCSRCRFRPADRVGYGQLTGTRRREPRVQGTGLPIELRPSRRSVDESQSDKGRRVILRTAWTNSPLTRRPIGIRCAGQGPIRFVAREQGGGPTTHRWAGQPSGQGSNPSSPGLEERNEAPGLYGPAAMPTPSFE